MTATVSTSYPFLMINHFKLVITFLFWLFSRLMALVETIVFTCVMLLVEGSTLIAAFILLVVMGFPSSVCRWIREWILLKVHRFDGVC